MGIHLREKLLADGRRSLYLDIYHNGKRRYEFLNIYLDKDTPANRLANREKRQTAVMVRNRVENELVQGRYGFERSHRRATSFFAFVEKLADTKSPGTRLIWMNLLRHLRKYTGDQDASFNQITKEWIEGFREYLLSGLSANSASTLFSVLKTALNDAVRNEIIGSNPMLRIPRKDHVKRPETRLRYLTFEELQQLAGKPCPDEEVGRAFLFACYSGLRLSDVERLTYGNIRSGRIEFSQQKTKSKEYVDLSAQAIALLGEIGEPDEQVFHLPGRDKIGRVLKAWAASAKIQQRITFHCSRHTYATLLLTYDVDLYTVSKLLGHKSIQATQVYAKIIDRKRKEAVGKLPALQPGQHDDTQDDAAPSVEARPEHAENG